MSKKLWRYATRLVAGALVVAAPVEALPGAPLSITTPCVARSTGQVSSDAASVNLGQQTTVRWSFTLGEGCTGTAKILFRDKTSSAVLDTGLTGLNGTAQHAPQSTGTYFVQVVLNDGWNNYGSAPITVLLPVNNGKPTVLITRADQSGLFAQAVSTENAIVLIGGHVTLDLSYMNELLVQPGVQIIGDRSVNPRGPRLFTLTGPPRLLYIGSVDGPSDNVHISGIRFDANPPDDPCDAVGLNDSTAITVVSSKNVEIDNSEFYGWRGSGVDIHDDLKNAEGNDLAALDRINPVWVHDNYMHDNQQPRYCGWDPWGGGHGGGYGVTVSEGGFALIERNVFHKNRHAIAGHGSPGDGYLARGNLFFDPGLDKWAAGYTMLNHQIDMHGLDSCGDDNFNCGPAGEYMEVSYNTIVSPTSKAIHLRGTPSDPAGMKVFGNVFALDKSTSLVQNGSGLHDLGGNLFDQSAFLAAEFSNGAGDPGGRSCDFDRDGVRDTFRSTGAAWWYFSSIVGRWVYLHRSNLSDSQLRDVNGDGRCDVVTTTGSVFHTPSGAPFDITQPARTDTTIGQAASMQLAQVGSGRLIWRALGLPPGLSIDAVSGRITGTPSQLGTYAVKFRARNERGNIVDGYFDWTVEPVKVAVPDLQGMTLAAATSTLQFVGLAVHNGGTTPTDDSAANNRVVLQSRAAGVRVALGAVITVRLGRYTPDQCGPVAC